ncbi:hypothetical protein [Amycolatopsis jiangsuensis]|uniref:Lipoprotein LprG n=1 Tax=Amycolatopsis jiangsuensis TaxID=1181879 RepID=A0A840J583_9PSEU|nr:hypothetical protein [Amycolatopsis jiangsuensis]MBB4688568.1 hypothetical protein [Amycolatopsis jiangsuensis]
MRSAAAASVVPVVAGLVAVACAAGCSGDGPQRFADARALADAAAAATVAGRTATFTTDVTAGTFASHGEGRARFGPSGTALTMTTDYVGEPLELRLVDRALYAKVPDSARAQVTGGRPWVRVSPDGNDPFSQVLGGSLTQLAEQNDPARTLAQVREAGTLDSSEDTRLGGTAAEHYHLTVDLAKLGSALPAGLPADAMAQLAGRGTTVPLDLWLDPRDRPVQLVLDLSPILRATGESGGARITARYAGWGTPVTVDAPSAADVGTLTSG